MKYMLLIYRDETAMQRMSEQAVSETTGAYLAYTKTIRDSGILISGDRLGPSSAATTVRLTDGRSQVLNGPYAETREQLGGYYIIDVADLDAALSWAARCPGAQQGVVELRPIPADRTAG